MKKFWVLGFVMVLLVGSVSAGWLGDLFDFDTKLDKTLINAKIDGITISKINVNDFIVDDVEEGNSEINVRTEFREIPITKYYAGSQHIAQDVFIENKLSISKNINFSLIIIIEESKIHWGGDSYTITKSPLKLGTMLKNEEIITPAIIFGEYNKHIIYDDITAMGGYALAYNLDGENIIEFVINDYNLKAFEEKRIDPTYVNTSLGFLATGIGDSIGIAWDSSDNTFWIGDTANPDSVWHFTDAGVSLGESVISGNTGSITGIAYDYEHDKLYIGDDVNPKSLDLYSTVPAYESTFITNNIAVYGNTYYNGLIMINNNNGIIRVHNTSGDLVDAATFDLGIVEDTRAGSHDNMTNYTYVIDQTTDYFFILNKTYGNITNEPNIGFHVPTLTGGGTVVTGLCYNQSGGYWILDSANDFVYHVVDTDWTPGYSDSIQALNLIINSTQPTLNETDNNLQATFKCISTNATTIFYNFSWYNTTTYGTMAKTGINYYGHDWNVTNDTLQTVTLASGNTTEWDRWRFDVDCCDYKGCSGVESSSELFIIPKYDTYNITNTTPPDVTEGTPIGVNLTVWTNNRRINGAGLWANLTYNGTNYSMTRTQLFSDSYRTGYLFYNTIPAAQVISDWNITGIWNMTYYLLNNTFIGNNTYTFRHLVEESGMYICSGLGAVNNATQFIVYNFTAWNETSNTRLRYNNTFEGYFVLYTGAPSTNVTVYISNSSFDELTLCASPITTSFNVDGNVYYGHEGFDNRYRYYDEFYAAANTTNNELLYLLSDTESTAITYQVKNSNNLPMSEVEIRIYKYYPATDTEILIDELMTNVDGEDIAYLEMDGPTYRWDAYVDGVLRYTGVRSKILSTTILITITTNDMWEAWDNLAGTTVSVTNDSKSCIFNYIAPAEPLTQVCFRVNMFQAGSQATIAQRCVSGATSTAYSYNFPNTTIDVSYTCYILGKQGDASVYKILDSLIVVYKENVDKLYNLIGKDGLLIGGFIFVGIMIFSFLFSPVIAVIMAVFGMLAMFALGMITFSNPLMVIFSFVAIAGIVIWRMTQK